MGVTKTILVEGNGPSPEKGDTVTMLYTGWLKEAGKKDGKGKQFDTTEKPGRGPFKTAIGVGRVIKGMFFFVTGRFNARQRNTMQSNAMQCGWVRLG